MTNVFQIGGKVSGRSFIGREKELNYLKKMFLESDDRTGKAIVGLTRMGKSSMAVNAFDDVPNGTIYVYEDLNEWSTYEELWQDIAESIRESLQCSQRLSGTMNENIDVLQTDSLPWIKFNRTVKKIFEELAVIGLKTIIVLDEFDNASSLFSEGTKHFELFRTIFSDAKYNVSALTISRRNLHTIEGATYQSSTFHGVLDIIPFKGFDDDDMNEYFRVFEDNGIMLDEEQKDEIVYYAGRAPFLLSIMGHYIVEAASTANEIDITDIFMNKCKAINDYYRDCIEHMKRDDDLKRIIPFVIGPNVGVTQNDRDELFNLGYLREEDGELVAISDYFVSFLSANMIQVDIWDNIISLEKKIKLLIESEMVSVIKHFRVAGESVIAIQRNMFESVPGISAGDLARYDSFIINNRKVFNVESSYLDVISLNDAFKVIGSCWSDIFAKYFNDDLLEDWEYKFEKCAKARNPIAHGHEEYLSDTDKNDIDAYCKLIFDVLSANDVHSSNSASESAILEAAKEYDCNTTIREKMQYEEPVSDLIDCEVDFYVVRRGGVQRKNLQGIVEGKYKGTIPKNFVQSMNLDEIIGKTIKVNVQRIDGDHYVLETIENCEKVEGPSLTYSIGDLVAAEIS